ncbi:MAG: hypothetical protein RH859_13240 [Longimicrobiales bacterium]
MAGAAALSVTLFLFDWGFTIATAAWLLAVWWQCGQASEDRPTNPREVRFNLFFYSLLAGAFVSLLTGLHGAVGLPQYIAGLEPFGSVDTPLALPVFTGVLIGAYYLAVRTILADNWLDDRGFAESLYYLGFLLTLTALIATMAAFGSQVNQGLSDRDTVLKMIQLNGMALISTVIGLFLRIKVREQQRVQDGFPPRDGAAPLAGR